MERNTWIPLAGLAMFFAVYAVDDYLDRPLGLPRYGQPESPALAKQRLADYETVNVAAVGESNRIYTIKVGSQILQATLVRRGEHHTCAITTERAAVCWGSNDNGQLGDGTEQDRTEPVVVRGLSSGVISLDAGTFHNCAVTLDGAAYCWGANFGQLGDATKEQSNTPVKVIALHEPATSVAAGLIHSCVSTVSGRVLCWGRNDMGQLGAGSESTAWERLVPGPVEGSSVKVRSVSASNNHTCAIPVGNNFVLCWGDNRWGQSGPHSIRGVPMPIPVDSPALSLELTARETCAIDKYDRRTCWGESGTPKFALPQWMQELANIFREESAQVRP